MKSEPSVPFYIQQFAQHLLANYQFFPPRKDRLLALVKAANDENLKDFYKRLADSDPEQVKKLIFLFIMIDPDFAFERSDVEIKAQKELIPRIRGWCSRHGYGTHQSLNNQGVVNFHIHIENTTQID